MRSRPGARELGLVAIVFAVVACDRVTKALAERGLAETPGKSWLGDSVRLEFTRNPGAFLGMGGDLPGWARTAIFTVATGLGLGALGALLIFGSTGDRRTTLGLTLLWAGGISNWWDRVLHGSTVDFMNVGLGALRTGIFNVADMAIMAGGALLVIAYAGGRHGGPPEAAPPADITAPGETTP